MRWILALALVAFPLFVLAEPATMQTAGPDVGAWLTDTLGPAAAKWIALLGVIALFASWLLTTINGLEAVLVKAGWWSGERRGIYLAAYTVMHFLAQNLSRFFPSRAGQLRQAASSSR